MTKTALRLMPENPDRRRFIGGSDAAAIMGMSNFRTAYDTYLAKTESEPAGMDPAKKKFLERRKRWEPVVVQMLREELDAEIVSVNQRYIDPEIDYFAAEIDAEPKEGDDLLNVEMKTVHPRAYGEKYGWGEPGTGDVPVDYEAQVQFGLGVTGRKRAVLAAMVGIDDMLFYPIERDDVVIQAMRAACQKFWLENVVARVAPEPNTISDLHKMYRTSEEKLEVVATDEIGSKALQLRGLRSQISSIELQMEALEFDVKRALGKAEALIVDGRRIFTWKEQNWSRLDQDGIKTKEKEIYKKYLLSGKHRIFKHLTS